MYEDQTYEAVMERAIDNARDDIDTTEGSIFYSALAPAAQEFTIHYIELNGIIEQGYADTCDREHLLLRCKERGIYPSEPTLAILKGEFDVDIGLEKRFSLDELNYVSVEYIGKSEDGTKFCYQMECEDPGAEGNSHFGDLEAIDFIEGLEYAKLTELLIPGEDEEDTEALRARYFSSFDTAPFGGNKKDYREKTNKIAGVGDTKVIPAWNGGGTVKLIIINSEYNKASSVLINTVQQAIDPLEDQGNGSGIAPIGHIVTVVTVREVGITVTAEFVYGSEYSWAKLSSEITKAIEDYLLEMRKDWANQSFLIVRTTQVEARLLKITGIVDIKNTKINGVADNLTLEEDQIPVLTEVKEG